MSFACHRCGRAVRTREGFSCFCGKMCYELWHGAWERRSSGLAKWDKPVWSSEWPNENIHFISSQPSPYELGDLDGWGHQVRILEDIDDFADQEKWAAVA